MTWAGAGVFWSLSGGVPRTLGLLGSTEAAATPQSSLLFVQISDSQIGFHLPPNPDPVATLMEAIDKIEAMLGQPAFLVHTGDISHTSKEEQWDAAEQVIKTANKQEFYILGEHDVADADSSKAYLARFGKERAAKAGTASTWPACTSLACSTSSISSLGSSRRDWRPLATSNSTG